jgi:hypothetical protein
MYYKIYSLESLDVLLSNDIIFTISFESVVSVRDKTIVRKKKPMLVISDSFV